MRRWRVDNIHTECRDGKWTATISVPGLWVAAVAESELDAVKGLVRKLARRLEDLEP
jgi:hypothetical protein